MYYILAKPGKKENKHIDFLGGHDAIISVEKADTLRSLVLKRAKEMETRFNLSFIAAFVDLI